VLVLWLGNEKFAITCAGPDDEGFPLIGDYFALSDATAADFLKL